jgi:hypothetical protein
MEPVILIRVRFMRGASGVQYDFWQAVYPQVRSQVDQNPTTALSKDLTQNDFKPPAQLYQCLKRRPKGSCFASIHANVSTLVLLL